MKNNLIIGVLVALVIGAGGGFFVGMKYQQGKAPTGNQQFTGGRNFGGAGGPTGQNRFRNGGGQVVGEILSQDNNSITVKMQDGSSKIIILSSTTTISKAQAGTVSDLKVGERVAAFGTANSDGSVTATNIQLNPVQRVMPTGTQGGTGSGTPR
jgi:hypothetical protein